MKSLRERAASLLQSVLDGTASDDERGELACIYGEHPQLADEAAPELLVHTLLQWQSEDIAADVSGAEERPLAPVAPRERQSENADSSRRQVVSQRRERPLEGRRRFPRMTAARFSLAATILAIVGTVGYFWPTSGDRFERPLTMLADLDGVTWKAGKAPQNLDDVIGSTLHSLSGVYTLNLPAVTAQVQGPSEIAATSPSRIELRHGTIAARVEKAGRGFTVVTPQAEVIDRGTMFDVATTSATSTDVIVMSGIVDVRRRGAKGATRLTQGEAVRLDLSRKGFPMRLLQARFDASGAWIPADDVAEGIDSDAIGRHGVIAAVRDRIPVGEVQPHRCYQIFAEGLRNDCIAFADYDGRWHGMQSDELPRFLRDADYVKTFNAYRYNQGLELQVTLAAAADVYVFFDDRVPVPNWLALGFKETDVDVRLLETRTLEPAGVADDAAEPERFERVFSIWRRRVASPETVVMGDLGPSGEDRLMYGVAAVPIRDARPWSADQ